MFQCYHRGGISPARLSTAVLAGANHPQGRLCGFMPVFESTGFKPAWWLRNAHLQTLWPVLWRRFPRPVTTRERLQTSDKDFIDLDWYGEEPAPIVILLHGLSGSSRSPYIGGIQTALRKRGFRTVAMNFRGCSSQPNQTARCYHSGDTEDLDYLYRNLLQTYPKTPLAAVGYSLGGNVLLKWLGEGMRNVNLFAAIAVSAPLLFSIRFGMFTITMRNRVLASI